MERIFPRFPDPSDPYSTIENPRWLAPIVAAAALLLLLTWLFMGFYLYYRFAGPIAQGVRMGEITIGGLTVEQAAARIDNYWNRDRVLRVSDGLHFWEARPLEFGLWVDPIASARQAYAYGRTPTRYFETVRSILGIRPPEIRPGILFSPQAAAAQLAYWGPLVDREPEPASLQYQNGQWRAVPGAPGALFDQEATLRQMGEDYALIMLTGYLPLVTGEVPSPVEALAQKIPELEDLLNRPLSVHGYDPISNQTVAWDVPKETLAGWIRVAVIDGEMHLSIDESAFPAYLESLQERLTDGRTVWLPPDTYDLTGRWQHGQPYTVILRHPATTHTIEPGDTLLKISYRLNIPAWMILRENPGLNPDAIPAGAVLAIPSKSDLLPLPVIVGKRIIISIGSQRMYIYENGSQIRDFVISTGIDRSPTQPGVFQVQTHHLEAYASVWDLYMPHFLGIYEAWPGFMNGIHGLPTLSSGQRLWAGNLGRPVSYGCIILNLEAAEWLFHWAERGVVVEITS